MIRLSAFTIVLLVGTAASAQEPGGIKGCINSSIIDGKLHLTHIIEGMGDVISRDEWVVRCEGPAAIAAWDQFYALRRDDPPEVIGPNGGHALLMKTGTGSRCMVP